MPGPRDQIHQLVPTARPCCSSLRSIATYGLAGKSRDLLEPKAGTSHSAVVRYAILLLGAFTTLVITLVLFGVPVSQLLVGGALATVFVSIAAQQALGNVFAGLVLVFARPFKVGDAIRLRAGALGGTLDGIVTDIGITYVRFDTGGSVMSIPNSQVLNAVVGPIPPNDTDDGQAPQAPAVIDSKSGAPGGPEQPQPGAAGTGLAESPRAEIGGRAGPSSASLVAEDVGAAFLGSQDVGAARPRARAHRCPPCLGSQDVRAAGLGPEHIGAAGLSARARRCRPLRAQARPGNQSS